MEGLFVPLALQLPILTQKSVQLDPETVSKTKDRSGIPCLPAGLPTPAEAGFAKAERLRAEARRDGLGSLSRFTPKRGAPRLKALVFCEGG
jgi:hypothetical protein